MTIVRPTQDQIGLYSRFVHYLNVNNGQMDANDTVYYKFLDENMVQHSDVMRVIVLCRKLLPEGMPYVLHVDGRTVKIEGGRFYLTTNDRNIVKDLNEVSLPTFVPIKKNATVAIVPVVKDEKAEWTKDEVIKLLTTEAHVVGRMLGVGYDLLEPLHGQWIREWLLNPKRLKVLIHQAHRDSYKSSCLRLAVAIMVIMKPLETVLVIRKSEDAVKELINGVSKILDTPLFHKFVDVLYPDVRNKGGFKKTVDTALSIDTNLNVSLSGEYQIRALGLGSPLTGKHSSVIITDDIVVTSDRESEAERKNTISKYQEMMNLLSTNKGFKDTRIINIGTPWHEEDAFQLMEKGLISKTEEQELLENIASKERTDEQNERIRQLNMLRGKFVYNCYQTGLMTEEDIAWKKKVLNDDALFAANYLLTIVSDDEKPFPKINNVGNYKKSYFADAWEVFAQIDAKYSGVDTCSLTIGAYDWDTNRTVVYGRLWKISLDENYAELAEVMFNCGVQKLFMETNTDKGLMGNEFRGLGFNVEGYHESQNKHIKIVSTLRPFWREDGSEGFPCVQFVAETDEEYLAQIHNYKKGVAKDDAPDSLASLLLRSRFGAMSIRIT